MPENASKPVRFEDRVSWFKQARFGLFMHWGLYAMPAKYEWIRSTEKIPDEVYHRYAERFDPDKFDPRAWARLAREAGMKYFVVTTKHHDGFCLWDTKCTKWSAPHSAARRDLLRPIVNAFRAEGLRVGFYYSLQDWDHPQYPIDVFHPLRDREDAADLNRKRDVRKYAKFMRDQVTELLTQYGKIDVLWFDFSYPGRSYRGFPGKGRDAWESRRLLDLVHELSPDTLVNDRLDLPGEGDFMTVEQKQLDEAPRGGPQAISSSCLARCWENCHTFSGAWSYNRDESSWKSPKLCLQLLIQAVARGGNYILNVGPTARGEFDPRATDRLRVYADWMKLQRPLDPRLRRRARGVPRAGQVPLHLQREDEPALPAHPRLALRDAALPEPRPPRRLRAVPSRRIRGALQRERPRRADRPHVAPRRPDVLPPGRPAGRRPRPDDRDLPQVGAARVRPCSSRGSRPSRRRRRRGPRRGRP